PAPQQKPALLPAPKATAPAPARRARTAPPAEPAPAQAAAAPAQPQTGPGFVIVGEVPQEGDVHWVPVPEPLPTSEALDLPPPIPAFLDAWLAALSRDDAAAHAALGFPTSAAEFARVEASRESYRLVAAEISPRSNASQTFLRVVLSYAFQNGSGRFRTED